MFVKRIWEIGLTASTICIGSPQHNTPNLHELSCFLSATVN